MNCIVINIIKKKSITSNVQEDTSSTINVSELLIKIHYLINTV